MRRYLFGFVCALVFVLSVSFAPGCSETGGTGGSGGSGGDGGTGGTGGVSKRLDFVVVWDRDAKEGGVPPPSDVYVQGFAADGTEHFAQQMVSTERWASSPVVGMAQQGDFVVVWYDWPSHPGIGGRGGGDGDLFTDVLIRGFASEGTERFAKIAANSAPLEVAYSRPTPETAMAPNGDFVVVWRGGAGNPNIYARAFASDGSPRFDEVKVATETVGMALAVAIQPTGDFVVAWDHREGDWVDANVYAQGFAADGSPRFSEVKVTTETARKQYGHDTAMAASGDFVVVWQEDEPAELHARGFSANGTQRLAPMTVNAGGPASSARVAMAENGDFIVVWEGQAETSGIRARGFAADGSERFAEMTVNRGLETGSKPDVAMAHNGDFVVVWKHDSVGDGDSDIYARGFAADGTERFAEIKTNAGPPPWIDPPWNDFAPRVAIAP